MNTPQTAIGKGTVGEPPTPPPGKEGVIIKLSMFFDGTKNNRTNTNKRISEPGFIQLKGDESSYANFYSNVPILEYMNLRNKPEQHEVSVYTEGIGTVDFSERLKAAGVADADNGNDNQQGYAMGSGPTGIPDKVTKGINEAKDRLKEAYVEEDEYIREIIVDVFGFSRGAAAARHFVHRRLALQGPWPGQPSPPTLTINFVGLFETVSSYEPGGRNLAELLALAAQGKTEGIFADDVKQLGLNLGSVPAKVVHLTAGDEVRENFSLTSIDSSIAVGKGIELELPGVHSDVGGGYNESAQEETRRIRNLAEKQHLIAGGWYLPSQFKPAYEARTPEIRGRGVTIRGYRIPLTPTIPSQSVSIWEDGIRPLTNEYQYVPLFLMLDYARRHGQSKAAEFDSLTGEFAAYQVKSPLLVSLRDNFLAQAHEKEGRRHKGFIACPPGQLHPLRNQFLHRSHRSLTEFKIGMEPASEEQREIIDDRLLVDKPSVRAANSVGNAAQRAREAVGGALDRARRIWEGN